jgi:winged helix domain-containing protein
MSARYGLRQEDAPLLPPPPIKVPKRAMLDALYRAAAEGITTIEFPGVRVSAGILHLRRAGVDVQTIYEKHSGKFAGRHGRFVEKPRRTDLRRQPLARCLPYPQPLDRHGGAMSRRDYCWGADNEDVVLRTYVSVAVYENSYGDVVNATPWRKTTIG